MTNKQANSNMKLKPIPANTVVHTPTEEEAKELLAILHKNGYEWNSGDDLSVYSYAYNKEAIGFMENKKVVAYIYLSTAIDEGKSILTLAEFKELYFDDTCTDDCSSTVQVEKPQPKFKVNDMVKVVGYQTDCIATMGTHVGEVGVIIRAVEEDEDYFKITCDNGCYSWHKDWLEPYTEPETKSTEDMETKEHRNLSQDVANCDKSEGKERKMPPPKPKTTHNEFVERATTVHNGKYSYPDRYVGCMTKLRIVCPIHGEFWQTPNAHLKGHGCWKCASEKNKHLIYGIGINDLIHSKEHRILNIWRNMLQRCYDENHRDKYPTYKGCTVHQDWHLFSNFLLWYKENNPYGFEIDKDILVHGNKEYGPYTCCALPKDINVLIRPSELRNSVSVTKQGQYRVVYNLGKCRKYVETVSTYDEAIAIAKRIRQAQISELAVKYYERHEITNKVFKALISYSYE